MEARIAIVGAGFSGAVIAHELGMLDCEIEVFESRSHVAGNCHTVRDPQTGVMISPYGPHIFHTENERVWEYINRFGEMVPYNHKVKATVGGKVFSMPINLHTINQFYGATFSPTQAELFVEGKCKLGNVVRNFEDQALAMVGPDLYEAFLKGYTEKQWGMNACELPASILKRLPLRFNYNDSYFNHPHQAIPRDGYTAIIENMLKLDAITLRLNTPFRRKDAAAFDHVFYSGPLDDWYDRCYGKLPYRTLDFILDRHKIFDAQGCPVMNYCDRHVPYTRVVEYKHFSPWDRAEGTVVVKEYSRKWEEGDVPYYPIRLAGTQEALTRYEALAAKEERVTFVGRLGTFQYIDMDVTIARALDIADEWR